MDLKDFHLVSHRGAEFSDVLSLIQLQNSYITKIYKLIYLMNEDVSVSLNNGFREFMAHFNSFAQRQASSEGFSKAMEAVQIYHYVMLEQLLDSQILATAEQLEMAAGYLELLLRDSKLRVHPQITMLNQSIGLLEENQLKILENMEILVLESRRNHLQN